MFMLPTSSSMRTLPPWYGVITAPARWGHRPITEGRTWCMDNGVYTNAFNAHDFIQTLDRLATHRATCAFIAAPDVIGDAHRTLEQWPRWRDIIHARNLPAALVAQDGLKPKQIPTDTDAVFIGGTTDWKLGPDALAVIESANTRGLWTHVGRVNSLKRLRHFALAHVNSADGTYSAFAGVPNAVRLFNQALTQPHLWSYQ